MLSKADLRPDQVEVAEWLRHRTEAFVILPVGFGKTIVTLTAIQEIRNVFTSPASSSPRAGNTKRCLAPYAQTTRVHESVGETVVEPHREGASGGIPILGSRWRTLVVSTKNIINHTWGQEIAAWEHTQGLSYASAAGRVSSAVLERPDVLGINFESLEWFYDLCDADPSLLPEMLVIDESSKMKSHSAKRVKRHCGFQTRGGPRSKGYVHKFKRRFNLSATPNPEGYSGLWAQEACISHRRRLGANITMFRDRYCHTHWNGICNTYSVTAESERKIEDALRPISFVAQSQKYMDLPDPIHSKVTVPWHAVARAEYEALEDEFLLRVSELSEDGSVTSSMIEAPNVAVLGNKLRQACSGFVYDGQGKPIWLSDPEAKVRALEGVIERAAGDPVLVFTQYIAEADMLRDHFEGLQLGLPKSLAAWNAGDVPIMCVHPRSTSHGINLQHGSHTAVFYSLPYSFEEWHQGWGRLHRTGQSHQVSVLRLDRPNSVEQDVWAKVQSKGRKLDTFITNVKKKRREE